MNTNHPLPPGQHLAAPGKWPVVGERMPDASDGWCGVSISGHCERPRQWSFAQLQQLPQTELVTDIHCVTRWSLRDVSFGGVWLEDLLREVSPTPQAQFISLIAHSPRAHSTSLPLREARELRTLVALTCRGQPLSTTMGGPVRVVVPGRYFYKSLKWLARVELLAEDRLGFWEGAAGYHNHADPWREERYVAPQVNRAELARRLATLDFQLADMQGLDLSSRDLPGFRARGALLRHADFRRASLEGAEFLEANLTNARFQNANLRRASFRGADLEGADFSGADVRGADFSGASLFGTTFCGGDLSTNTPVDAAVIDETTRYSPASLLALAPLQAALLRRGTPSD